MAPKLRVFIADQAGAVSVDWVVLTALLVGLGFSVISVVSAGMENMTNDIASELAGRDVTANPFDVNIDITDP